jgi:hypothetical protein
MKLLVTMQIAWALVVLPFAGFQFFFGRGLVSGLIVVVCVVYLFVSVVLLDRVRWAWWCSFIPPIGSLVLYGPNVGFNLWQVSRIDDPRFTAFVYVIPPIMLLLRLTMVRRELLPNKTMGLGC